MLLFGSVMIVPFFCLFVCLVHHIFSTREGDRRLCCYGGKMRFFS